MGEIVNLRLERKRAARRAAEAQAADNRAAHGVPKAVSRLAARQADLDRRRLDAHRLGAGDAPAASDGPLGLPSPDGEG